MADTADHYLGDSDLTAADRAVMEFLYPIEKLSVPALAGKYRVSRQHVQVTANGLLSKGLLRSEPNPRHKRSPLMRLGELGRETFAEIRRNEAKLIEKMFADLSSTDIEITRQSLRSLLDHCKSGEIS